MKSNVHTGEITTHLQAYLSAQAFSRIGVLVDENTHRHCLRSIAPVLPASYDLLEIPSGEINKNIETTSEIWEWMTSNKWDRQALLINLGGGVIGDMGGFAASTYKRGITFINIPTTLLAMVDASMGGKLGIDFDGYKNHIGLFRDPDRVFIDATFLKTLPGRQLKSGFAEVVKHALIASTAYWEELQHQHFPHYNWEQIITRSIQIKKEVVDADPLEKGLRKILNFGHTLGHAIETYFLETDRMLYHGEAIAVGMKLETKLSEKFAGLSPETSTKIQNQLHKWFGEVSIPKYAHNKIIELCRQDKKNDSGTYRFSLIEDAGRAVYDVEIPERALYDVLNYAN
jgi:3-dehydroquinate synthase